MRNDKNKTWVVSTLVAGLLAVSGTSFAATSAQVDAKANASANTGMVKAATHANHSAKVNLDKPAVLSKKIEDKRGELLATQPGKVAVETDTRLHKIENELNRVEEQANQANAQAKNAQAKQAELALRGNNDKLASATPAPDFPDNASVNAQENTPALVATAPLIKGEATMGFEPAPITLQKRIKDRVGELQATQPGEVQFQENRRIRVQ